MENVIVSARAKGEYVQAIYQRYRRAGRPEKRRILDEFCQVAGYHRKHAIRVLNGPAPGAARPPQRRAATYSPGVIEALRAVWEAAGYPWSLRLKALLPLWLPWARRRLRLRPAVERQLLAISPRQIDRRLAGHRRQLTKRLYGRTKPGTLLKHHIPLKTDRWNVATPGFTEIDLVAHCGSLGDGEFVHSLNLTDIHTTWVETAAVLGKSQVAVQAALEELRQALPFRLRGIDSDNGSEFINQHLWDSARPRRSSSREAGPTRRTTTPTSNRRTGPTSASCWATCATTARPPGPRSTPSTATSFGSSKTSSCPPSSSCARSGSAAASAGGTMRHALP